MLQVVKKTNGKHILTLKHQNAYVILTKNPKNPKKPKTLNQYLISLNVNVEIYISIDKAYINIELYVGHFRDQIIL